MQPRGDTGADGSELTLAILAGGRGERLGGAEKGLLRIGGRTLIERQLALAGGMREVLLVTPRPAPYADLPVRLVTDERVGRGPGAGLAAALAAARTPWVLVLGCDMPFVTPEVLGLLVAAREEGRELIRFQGGGRPHPLPALVRASLAPVLAARVEAEGAPGLLSLSRSAACFELPEAILRARGSRAAQRPGDQHPGGARRRRGRAAR